MNKLRRDLITDTFQDDMIFLDPPEQYDKFIAGVVENHNGNFVPIYDGGKVIESLIHDSQMSPDEAREYFDFNIEGAKFGDQTPMFLWRVDDNITL